MRAVRPFRLVPGFLFMVIFPRFLIIRRLFRLFLMPRKRLSLFRLPFVTVFPMILPNCLIFLVKKRIMRKVLSLVFLRHRKSLLKVCQSLKRAVRVNRRLRLLLDTILRTDTQMKKSTFRHMKRVINGIRRYGPGSYKLPLYAEGKWHRFLRKKRR